MSAEAMEAAGNHQRSCDASDYDSEAERKKKAEDEIQIQLTEKGKRMAANLAEILLMRFFFPDTKDRKK